MAEKAKKWWASKSIQVQVIALLGTCLIGAGIVGEAQWAVYSGAASQILGIVMRFITKSEIA